MKTNPSLTVLVFVLSLTSAVAQSTSAFPPGLISWWRAEGNSADATGAHAGLAEGDLTYANGQRGQCFVLNGGNAAVWLGTWFTLQQFTLSLWVNPADGQMGYADLMDNNHDSSVSWPIQFQNFNEGGISRWQWGPNGGTGGLINFDLQINAWQHLVIARDGTNGTALYLNGALAGTSSGAYSPIPYNGSQVLHLGRHQSFGRYFLGMVD